MAPVVAAPSALARIFGIIGNGRTKKLPVREQYRAGRSSIRLRTPQWRRNRSPGVGCEFCGKPATHPYELLLAIEDIEHRNTKVGTPRTNGFVERMNRTLLDECFRVKGRENWYLTIDEIQRDLDTFMTHYNLERSHQGYRLNGRTPAQALIDALGIAKLPSLRFEPRTSTDKEVTADAETT